MKTIVISQELAAILPDFHVGVLSFQATPQPYIEGSPLDTYLKKLQSSIQQQYQLADVLKIPNILAGRNAYKALGKDPSRYRLAVESLYRRIVKGNPLYRINDIVDIGNVLSLQTMRSTAVLDEDQIVGETITIRIGRQEPYEGIGRGPLNVENMPLYCDEVGPFGSPTSDTQRTAITDNTTKVLVLIISFNGYTNLEEDLQLAKILYERYSNAQNFTWGIF